MSERQEMSPEHAEFYAFLRQHSPFSELPNSALTETASNLVITYYKAQSQIKLDDNVDCLYMVRTGAVLITGTDNRLLDKVSSGGFFGFPALLRGRRIGNHIEAIEDCLIYQIDEQTFKNLRDKYTVFALYFDQQYNKRLSTSLLDRSEKSLYSQQVEQIMSTPLITVQPNATVFETANLMTQHGISCLAVVDQHQSLLGIVTDRDLRKRVISQRRSYDDQVQTIMTTEPIVTKSNAFADHAMFLMIKNNIHHLPVIENKKPIAMLTATDMIRQQKSDPILLMNRISKAEDVQNLIDASHAIKGLLQNMIAADIKAEALGRILTTVTGALTRRLIHLAQAQLGPEPVPFVWIAFGSQGRQDQSAKSDQDNALLLHDCVQKQHDEYFKKLADFVCDGLDACGYVHCPGDIMASNQKWRQPLQAWQKYFIDWVEKPNPIALLNASIFFDLRQIYCSQGAEGLMSELKETLKESVQNQRFLACLTLNALNLQPPLGFFKKIVVNRAGEHKDTFDIKRTGLMPLTDIIRINALAHATPEVNSILRLRYLLDNGMLEAQQANNLLDAHEFIAHLRLVHQGQQMDQGIAPNNQINPEHLSGLMQRQLKDAFQIIRDAQRSLKNRFAKDFPS